MNGRKKHVPKHGMAPIAELIARWRRKSRVSERAKPDFHDGWRSVVGEDVARRTRIIDLSQGELVVEVDSAPLLNELSTYFKKEILESLRMLEEFRGIHKLRFRTGSFDGRDSPPLTPPEGEEKNRERRSEE